jgi:hypothetical protein
LSISSAGTNITLRWFSPWGGWALERRVANEWCASPPVVPAEGKGMFRLRRLL